MDKWNGWSFYWVVIWFVLGFGVPEGIALATGNAQDTLSAQVWHLDGSFGPPWTWTAAHYFVAAGCVWLAIHFTFRLFT